MSKEAHFTITETSDGAQFDITPASKPASFGCMVVCVYAMGAIGALIALVGLVSGSGGQLIGGLVLAVPVAVGFFIFRQMANAHDRVPVRMLVNPDGITIGQRFYAASDIRELILRLPHDAGGAEMVTYHTKASAQAGAAIGLELRNRSYALMARLKSSSKPEILAFGLTHNVGDSLLKDVSAALHGRL